MFYFRRNIEISDPFFDLSDGNLSFIIICPMTLVVVIGFLCWLYWIIRGYDKWKSNNKLSYEISATKLANKLNDGISV